MANDIGLFVGALAITFILIQGAAWLLRKIGQDRLGLAHVFVAVVSILTLSLLLSFPPAYASQDQASQDQAIADKFISDLPSVCTGYTTTTADGAVKFHYTCPDQSEQTITIKGGRVIDIQPRE